ncbi:MAG TPA: BrnT family toxin, partial [Bauldia sp.]|nr:BrnT family toxin [Bauldia sp.]
MIVGGFDRDNGNRSKCQKHGVSIREIEIMLASDPLIAPDLRHSDVEDRYIAIGRGNGNRAMFVAFTYRLRGDVQLIRP